MNKSEYTTEELARIYQYISLNVACEMILATAFILVLLLAIASIFNLKKTSLVFLLAFGVITFFIPSGYTLYISPTIAVVATIGLFSEFFRLSAPTAQ